MGLGHGGRRVVVPGEEGRRRCRTDHGMTAPGIGDAREMRRDRRHGAARRCTLIAEVVDGVHTGLERDEEQDRK